MMTTLHKTVAMEPVDRGLETISLDEYKPALPEEVLADGCYTFENMKLDFLKDSYLEGPVQVVVAEGRVSDVYPDCGVERDDLFNILKYGVDSGEVTVKGVFQGGVLSGAAEVWICGSDEDGADDQLILYLNGVFEKGCLINSVVLMDYRESGGDYAEVSFKDNPISVLTLGDLLTKTFASTQPTNSGMETPKKETSVPKTPKKTRVQMLRDQLFGQEAPIPKSPVHSYSPAPSQSFSQSSEVSLVVNGSDLSSIVFQKEALMGDDTLMHLRSGWTYTGNYKLKVSEGKLVKTPHGEGRVWKGSTEGDPYDYQIVVTVDADSLNTKKLTICEPLQGKEQYEECDLLLSTETCTFNTDFSEMSYASGVVYVGDAEFDFSLSSKTKIEGVYDAVSGNVRLQNEVASEDIGEDHRVYSDGDRVAEARRQTILFLNKENGLNSSVLGVYRGTMCQLRETQCFEGETADYLSDVMSQYAIPNDLKPSVQEQLSGMDELAVQQLLDSNYNGVLTVGGTSFEYGRKRSLEDVLGRYMINEGSMSLLKLSVEDAHKELKKKTFAELKGILESSEDLTLLGIHFMHPSKINNR